MSLSINQRCFIKLPKVGDKTTISSYVPKVLSLSQFAPLVFFWHFPKWFNTLVCSSSRISETSYLGARFVGFDFSSHVRVFTFANIYVKLWILSLFIHSCPMKSQISNVLYSWWCSLRHIHFSPTHEQFHEQFRRKATGDWLHCETLGWITWASSLWSGLHHSCHLIHTCRDTLTSFCDIRIYKLLPHSPVGSRLGGIRNVVDIIIVLLANRLANSTISFRP